MYSSLTAEEEEEASLFIYPAFAYFPVISLPAPSLCYHRLWREIFQRFNRFCIRAALTFPRPQRSPCTRRNPLLCGTPSPPPAPPRYHFGKLYPRLWIHIRAGRCEWLLPPRRARLTDALFTTGLLYAYSAPRRESAAAETFGELAGNEREERKSGAGLDYLAAGKVALRFQGPR